jgi:hypothetical protein
MRFAIPDSQQPISPIGFLFLKLPPPPCAVLLVIKTIIIVILIYDHICAYVHRWMGIVEETNIDYDPVAN